MMMMMMTMMITLLQFVNEKSEAQEMSFLSDKLKLIVLALDPIIPPYYPSLVRPNCLCVFRNYT